MVDESLPGQRSEMRRKIAEMSNEEVRALNMILRHIDLILAARGAPTFPGFQRMARRRRVPLPPICTGENLQNGEDNGA